MRVPFLAASLVFVGATAAIAAPDKKQETLQIGEDAPLFVLKTVNPEASGRPRITLRDFVGEDRSEKKSAIVLSFAASYCEPCKKELAELKKLKPELDKANVLLSVVVIDTDEEGIEAMRALTVDQLKLQFPVLSDRFGVLARRYFASSLPMTVVIEPSGKVKWVSAGFDETAIDRLKAQIGL